MKKSSSISLPMLFSFLFLLFVVDFNIGSIEQDDKNIFWSTVLFKRGISFGTWYISLDSLAKITP